MNAVRESSIVYRSLDTVDVETMMSTFKSIIDAFYLRPHPALSRVAHSGVQMRKEHLAETAK